MREEKSKQVGIAGRGNKTHSCRLLLMYFTLVEEAIQAMRTHFSVCVCPYVLVLRVKSRIYCFWIGERNESLARCVVHLLVALFPMLPSFLLSFRPQ